MERWNGRVAVVTGASSGIGAAIAKELAQAGLVTVGLARRVERVAALRDQIPKQSSANLHAIKCDVSKEEDIGRVFQEIVDKFGGIDVLINNAGIVRDSMRLLSEDSLGTQPRKACNSMRDRSVDGHIIHINSIAGHRVLNFPHMNMYSASKFAVTALTETMRNELREMKSKVKVTSISPGVVKTEIIDAMDNHKDFPMLEPKDIADAVLYVLGTPAHVQVHELTIKPVGEDF
ncbi:hypothetical protein pipiens_001027 [Culex pipiens pipiens]|uniref:Dehydrogenase n=1 Tax=Culex pipiens pipiens TaxID=38569 RepID=A0ABD1DYT0_CULPP